MCSALLALLGGEPGAERVEDRMATAVICGVNWAETATKLLQRGAPPQAVHDGLLSLHLDVVPWTEELVMASLDLCPLAWTQGFSLGDRACLATARARRAIALTADAAWVAVARQAWPPIAVELIRPVPRRR